MAVIMKVAYRNFSYNDSKTSERLCQKRNNCFVLNDIFIELCHFKTSYFMESCNFISKNVMGNYMCHYLYAHCNCLATEKISSQNL